MAPIGTDPRQVLAFRQENFKENSTGPAYHGEASRLGLKSRELQRPGNQLRAERRKTIWVKRASTAPSIR